MEPPTGGQNPWQLRPHLRVLIVHLDEGLDSSSGDVAFDYNLIPIGYTQIPSVW